MNTPVTHNEFFGDIEAICALVTLLWLLTQAVTQSVNHRWRKSVSEAVEGQKIATRLESIEKKQDEAATWMGEHEVHDEARFNRLETLARNRTNA